MSEDVEGGRLRTAMVAALGAVRSLMVVGKGKGTSSGR
jgi:hypothetical protein